jgi:nucleoside 2-deoxyribosyltransferase
MQRLTKFDLLQIIEGGETETVEFKSRLSSDASVGRVLSAFANTMGGTLLVGVAEHGDFPGVPDLEVKSTISRLKSIIDSLLPTQTQVGSVKVGGKNIIYASVEKAPESYGPVMLSTGTAYQRHYSDTDAVPLLEFYPPRLQEKISRVEAKREVTVFVAMSFRTEEEPHLLDYFSAMERSAEQTGLPVKLFRMDGVEGDFEISQEIMDQIDDVDIVIADFTLSPKNVYFEIGYARGKEKRIIQTARKDTKLEFDVHHWKTTYYRNATELEKKLIPELKSAYTDIVG